MGLTSLALRESLPQDIVGDPLHGINSLRFFLDEPNGIVIFSSRIRDSAKTFEEEPKCKAF